MINSRPIRDFHDLVLGTRKRIWYKGFEMGHGLNARGPLGFLLLMVLPFLLQVPLWSVDIRGDMSFEALAFPDDAAQPEPGRSAFSLKAQAELYWMSESGHEFILEPFGRVDSEDDDRDHVDLRQALWQKDFDEFSLRVGLGQVYWGQTEFLHLVNVVNQTDGIENPDAEDKLGQPMVEALWYTETGEVSFYLLPVFRERTFSGSGGRFRGPFPVDTDRAIYESGAKEFHPDFALRWAHLQGSLELGTSVFVGTDREPVLMVSGGSLRPHYYQTVRLGLESLYVWEDWIFKLEVLNAERQSEWEQALTGGFEWTKVGLLESEHDLGIILEGAWHSGGSSFTTFDRELMGGLRWVFNDEAGTEVLTGAIIDLDLGSTMASLEASRRLTDQWKLNLEGRFFFDVDPTDPLAVLREDSHLRSELQYYF